MKPAIAIRTSEFRKPRSFGRWFSTRAAARALRRSVGAAVTTRRGSHGTFTGALQPPSGRWVRTRLVVPVVVVVVKVGAVSYTHLTLPTILLV